MRTAPDVSTFSDARAAMRRPEFFKLQKWRDLKLVADRAGAHPDILQFEKSFVSKLESIGIPFYAHCVMRSRETQLKLWKAGRSKAKPGLSPHQYGYAVDLVHCVFNWELPKSPADPRAEKAWKIIGALGYEVGRSIGVDIEWGGDWKFYDPAHWQLRDWKRLADV